jgi:hypothetical protein
VSSGSAEHSRAITSPVSSAAPAADLFGVGIDLAEQSAFSHKAWSASGEVQRAVARSGAVPGLAVRRVRLDAAISQFCRVAATPRAARSADRASQRCAPTCCTRTA